TSCVRLHVCGTGLGVRLSAHEWLEMTLLMLVGLIPFAAIGIFLGHMFTADSIGPVIGGGVALLAILGGTWFPITSGLLLHIAQALPSYWLVQARPVAPRGASLGARGLVVRAAWSVVWPLLA